MNKETHEKVNKKMQAVKRTGSTIETALAKALWKKGLRYRKQYKKLKGTPDFVLIKYKLAIFCDSTFWHGYRNMNTKRHRFRSNQDFWINKIKRNIERDKEVNKELKSLGWKVIRIWDFEIVTDIDSVLLKIKKAINNA